VVSILHLKDLVCSATRNHKKDLFCIVTSKNQKHCTNQHLKIWQKTNYTNSIDDTRLMSCHHPKIILELRAGRVLFATILGHFMMLHLASSFKHIVRRQITFSLPNTYHGGTQSIPLRSFSKKSEQKRTLVQAGADSSNEGGDWWEGSSKDASKSKSSWMDRNQRFESRQDHPAKQPTKRDKKPEKQDTFLSTRVWVQDIPLDANWQDLKDHFRVAGEVVFASVSTDKQTQESKGCGIVQFETPEEASNAIKIMRNHPIITDSTGPKGAKLFVREDYQEQRGGASNFKGKKENRITTWTCANDENDNLDVEAISNIRSILEARDAARKRKNFPASDSMRDQLKDDYNVHIDDRMKLWWTHFEGDAVPSKLVEIKGDGRWADPKNKPWRQIPTLPEQDELVDSALVQRLLSQRDRARQKKDFDQADELLERARTAPRGDVYLRIHDESRTWRVWTDEPPPRPDTQTQPYSKRPSREKSFAETETNVVDQCMELVMKYDPEKTEEIRNLLSKFPGREFNILNKLKDRYGLL